ncbi:MAG TPA: FTR1 family protein [Verrucomicrobiae bacterium]|nr:FTR1 family protein [Verrucomicrobiae bacterium]
MRETTTTSRFPVALPTRPRRVLWRALLGIAVLVVAGVLVWQGIAAHGVPDPTTPDTSATVARLDIGVLVFREGLECILVLSAITASMVGRQQPHRRPVVMGATIGFAATVATWIVAVRVVSSLLENVSALHLQAATGLLAIIVLLVVMNWFFHKVYWGGWISMHTRRKTELLRDAGKAQISQARLRWGLCLLGFASLYREGFEVVLFLQSYQLRLGARTVLEGALLGLFFSGIVAVLTFVTHHRLPYRKMLVLTGVMLGLVLLVMVGEQGQEMQLAHWLPTTPIPALTKLIPAWMGMWFAVFPTVETLLGQALAAALVVGCYFAPRFRTPRGRPDQELNFPSSAASALPQLPR